MRRRDQVADRQLGAGRKHRAAPVLADRHVAQPEDRAGTGVEVHYERRVTVDAEDEDLRRQLVLEHPQPMLAEIAKARVVVAAFGVVVVRHDGHGQPDRRQQVQAL